MPYWIAGIDVHKKMLAVVVADVEVEGNYQFERHKVGISPGELRALADWLAEREVEEVVMESTAQYWRPVWEALELHWRPNRRTREGASPISGTLHLAQAQSNRGAGGRKKDFPDAERLVKRLVAQELTLSFVPDTEQRLWRTVMRRKYQITRSRVQLHNRLESLLEEAHIKVSSVVSDLLRTSARRMLHAVAEGETDPAALAALADQRLRATPDQLSNAFGACADLHPVYRRLVKLTLEELRVIEDHLGQLDQQMAALLSHHHDAVHRLAEVPGLGVDSAQQIIAEVGATAATFPSAKHLASWMGACPGTEESAGKNYSHRCPKGNRQMRRVLNQAANAAVKAKGTIFALVYRRLVPRLGHAQAIGAITHRLCRLIWKILHQGVRYEERGPAVSAEAKKVRARKMIRELRSLGYRMRTEPGSIEHRHDRERFSTLADPYGVMDSRPSRRQFDSDAGAPVRSYAMPLSIACCQWRFVQVSCARRHFCDACTWRSLLMARTLICTLLLLLAWNATGWAQILDVRELNTDQIARLDRARTVVLLTAGILEEHGPFLPSYSDGYQSEFIATRVAEAVAGRSSWTVLRFPDIPLGAFPASYVGRKYVFPGSYPVRMATLRAVFMDLATDLGEAGFRWVVVVTMHGGPTHNRALDEAGRYFNDSYAGRMVHVTGLASVAGAAPSDIFTSEQRAAEGFSIHADADEHSCVLFLRPDLVAPEFRSAPAVVARDFAQLVATAETPNWPGYFGTPAIANPEAGRRAMGAIAQAAVNVVLKVLDGGSDEGPRGADRSTAEPAFRRVVEAALEYERQIERKQAEWLAKQR